jgi:hypothetical protein
MGWTFTNRPPGKTDREFFSDRFGHPFTHSASINGAFYGVIEVPAEKEERLQPDDRGMVRLAVVILCKRERSPSDGYNFGWKEMDEFMGPNASECPPTLLKRLSPFKPEALIKPPPTEDGFEIHAPAQYAADWRERCRQAAENRATLVVGDRFTLPYTLNFSDGVEEASFTLVEKKGAKLRFRRPDGRLVRLPKTSIADLRLAGEQHQAAA